MKISDANKSMMPGINGTKTGKSKVKTAFQEVMNQVAERGGKEAEVPASVNTAHASPNITPPQLIRDLEGQDGIATRYKLMKEVENTLDLAGFYTQKLGDPGVKTTFLEPLVNHLEAKMEDLRFLQNNGKIDEELKAIVSDLDITLGTEVARFRRGDYS